LAAEESSKPVTYRLVLRKTARGLVIQFRGPRIPGQGGHSRQDRRQEGPAAL